MRFTPLELKGLFLVELEELRDDRGFFARSFCIDAFQKVGLHQSYPQCNVSFNTRKGTVRGMHFQVPPSAEVKLVRCTMGALLDVVVDLRSGSETYCRAQAVELSARNRKALYIPEGFAHGFQTLEDDTEMLYHMGEKYQPGCNSGLRWDDPAFSIQWPLPISSISEKDTSYPDMNSRVFFK